MHVTYRYGCPAWAELPAELVEELRLAHDYDLREELVDWEIAYDREREAILRDASAQYRVAAERWTPCWRPSSATGPPSPAPARKPPRFAKPRRDRPAPSSSR